MEKTKIGVSVFLLAALCCVLGLFGGYLPVVLVVGYILICEENGWLRRFAVSILALMVVFSILSFLLGLIPQLLDMLYTFLETCTIDLPRWMYEVRNTVANLFRLGVEGLGLIETLVFLLLGVLSLLRKSVRIPLLDKLVAKIVD